ncbi:MAG: hypothetical protein ABR875_03380 [Minisyncoccia bacterium]|jgi:hypothetical protein
MDSKTKDVAKEMRLGVVFTAKVLTEFGSVFLFVEGQEEPVGEIFISYLVDINPSDLPEQIADNAFQIWVRNNWFLRTVSDANLLSMLSIVRDEILGKVEVYRKTFRFLRAEGSTNKNPRFILTTDKSDLPERQRRILEVGEEVVLREEAEQKTARKLKAREEEDCKKNLRKEHTQFILKVTKEAFSKQGVSKEDAKKLFDLGLLERSTTFRSGALFPGEAFTLLYDYTEDGIEQMGFIGFDSNLELISIDGRLPNQGWIYLREQKKPSSSV